MVGECVPLENFRVVERGDTDRGGRVVVISCGRFLDVVRVEGPEAVGTDGGAVELVVGMVKVVHVDLAEVPRMVVVVEHTVVVHASGVIAASGVLLIFLDTGRRCRCRHCHHPLNSIPPFSP